MSRIAPDDDFRTDIEVLAAQRLVVVAVSGVLSVERLASLGQLVRERQPLTADWGVIYDFSGASAEKIFRADLEGLAAELKRPVGDRMHREAYVVPSDLSFGLARMYSVLADFAARGEGPRPRLVARTRAEALEWMRAPPTD